MICSDNSRCNKFDLIEIDGMFICKNCKVIFNKPFKIIINCCKKDPLIDDQIFHIVKIVKKLFVFSYLFIDHALFTKNYKLCKYVTLH